MSEVKPKKKMGRIPRPIDEKLVRELAKIQCTTAEIAACCGCSSDTIERRFKDVVASAKQEGKASLRRMQYLKAIEGNTSMLIWLGKHVLEQRDEVHIITTEPESKAIFKEWKRQGSLAIARMENQK
jgi:AraC-like DNA-binding protein